MTDRQRPEWAVKLQAGRETHIGGKHAMARLVLAEAGMTAPTFAQVKDMARQITRHEKGEHYPKVWESAYASVLGTTVEELFGPQHEPEPDAPPASTVEPVTIPDPWDDDVKRRAALQLMGTLGLGAGTIGAGPLHHLVDLALTAAPRTIDDWHLACLDHLHALRTRPAAQARQDLVIDLLALGRQLTIADGADVTELRRVEAGLAMLHANLSTRLGDHGAAIRWWRTARTAADTTGDLDLRLMTRCEEAGCGLYGQRDIETVLALTQAAGRIAGDGSSFWKADLAGTRAKAFSLLGQHDQAVRALNEYVSWGGPDARAGIFPTLWSFDQAHFAQSWVYAWAGNEAAADQARQVVLARNARRQGGASPYAVNVRLHEALCTVVTGGTDQGVRQAASLLDSVPVDYRAQLITETGHTVLRAVPADQRDRPAVREFCEVLANTAPRAALVGGT